MLNPSREEVLAFIKVNNLQDNAVEAMWNVSEPIRGTVIALGNFTNCRNPTASCLGRIKNLQAKEGELFFMAQRNELISQEVSNEELEQFLSNNQIHQRASRMLREVPPIVQRQVIDSGPVKGRNIDAVLVSRICNVQSGQAFEVNPIRWSTPTVPAAAAGTTAVAASEEVEQFISTHCLEPGAANVLRSSGPMVQRAVLDQGPLRGRNINAVCVSRIHTAVQNLQEQEATATSSHWHGSEDQDLPAPQPVGEKITNQSWQPIRQSWQSVGQSWQPVGEKRSNPYGQGYVNLSYGVPHPPAQRPRLYVNNAFASPPAPAPGYDY